MRKRSAGILVYRTREDGFEVFLAHPGGPYWAGKDEGAWTIPKGECQENEEPLSTARREFSEETGFAAEGPFIPLGSVKQRSGKVVYAWAAEGNHDAARIRSNTFTMEWPPKSKGLREFPEIDSAGWFSIDQARIKIKPEQFAFIERLQETLKSERPMGPGATRIARFYGENKNLKDEE